MQCDLWSRPVERAVLAAPQLPRVGSATAPHSGLLGPPWPRVPWLSPLHSGHTLSCGAFPGVHPGHSAAPALWPPGTGRNLQAAGSRERALPQWDGRIVTWLSPLQVERGRHRVLHAGRLPAFYGADRRREGDEYPKGELRVQGQGVGSSPNPDPIPP